VVRSRVAGPVECDDVLVAQRPEALQLSDHLQREASVLGWPKICTLAHAFRWEYSYKRLELAQLLGKLGIFLT
jgi:hypothetical protein